MRLGREEMARLRGADWGGVRTAGGASLHLRLLKCCLSGKKDNSRTETSRTLPALPAFCLYNFVVCSHACAKLFEYSVSFYQFRHITCCRRLLPIRAWAVLLLCRNWQFSLCHFPTNQYSHQVWTMIFTRLRRFSRFLNLDNQVNLVKIVVQDLLTTRFPPTTFTLG